MYSKNLKWEQLSKKYGVYIGKPHGFTTDTLLLAEFSKPKKHEICADFGTGSGTIPIMWQCISPPKHAYGIEIQKEAAEQAEESVKRNGLSEQIEILNRDLREYKKILPHQHLDIIACNPPYKAQGAGIVNEAEEKRTARHEDALTPQDIAKAAAYMLKHGGRICLCQRPERLLDFMTIFKSFSLEPKRLQLVQQDESHAPSLFLLECKRGGKPGMSIEPALMISKWKGYGHLL